MILNRRFSLLFCLTVTLAVALPVRALPPHPVTTLQVPLVAQAPALPALPVNAPEPIEPVLDGISEVAMNEDWDGIGYLQPTSPAAEQAGWLREVSLPLYASADGEHWGWLLNGWLIPNGQPAFAIGRDAGFTMVRTAPTQLAFPILERRDDGWIRVQYTDGGSAWVHVDHLDNRGLALSATLTESPIANTGANISVAQQLAAAERLQFRQAVAAQVLRSQPELNRNVISLVSADSLIEPIEVSGDWVKVRVISPVDGCVPLSRAESEEGWMRWRGPDGDVLLGEGESCS
ncbi:MAG: SH3 domain-containing protein [Cyanobacteria bacterium J06628_6]